MNKKRKRKPERHRRWEEGETERRCYREIDGKKDRSYRRKRKEDGAIVGDIRRMGGGSDNGGGLMVVRRLMCPRS
ncbi:hypothetical protein U1Q18_010276 [Sarracenia purpurea var. burkii]